MLHQYPRCHLTDSFLEYLLIIFTYSKRGDFNSCVLFSSLHTHNGTENLRGHIFSQERP